MRVLLLMLVFVLYGSLAHADGDFVIDDSGVLTGYVGSATELVIPDSVNAIGNGAFSDCDFIETIVIPDGVTRIGERAFLRCSALEDVTFGSGLESIEWCAFEDCQALGSISLPSALRSIGTSAFSSCYSLREIELPEGLERIADSTFYRCYSLEELILPDSVTELGENAFSNCGSLRTVHLGSGLKNIGGGAFSGCISLGSLNVFPEGLESIGSNAFGDCPLESILLPDTVTFLGDNPFSLSAVKEFRWSAGMDTVPSNYFRYSGVERVIIPEGVVALGTERPSSYYSYSVFEGCSNLREVSLPSTLTYMAPDTFINCTSLEEITLPEGLTEINDGTFWGCSSLRSIVIPDGITRIGDHAFFRCPALEDVTFGSGVESIGWSAFEECPALGSISLPSALRSIGTSAFSSCYSLGEIALPEGLERIADSTFNRCDSLQELTLPDSVAELGECAFSSCVNLRTVRLGSGLKSIGGGAFSGCNSLESLNVFPEGLESIGSNAFSDCPLASILLPDTVTFLGDNPFSLSAVKEFRWSGGVDTVPNNFFRYSGVEKVIIPEGVVALGTGQPSSYYSNGVFECCGSLKEVSLPSTLTYMNPETFINCASLEEIALSEGLTEINDGTFWGCSSLRSIVIPDGITRIGDHAFFRCSALEDVAFGSGVESIGWGAFGECQALGSISLPSALRSIGTSAFSSCYSLGEIALPEGLERIADSTFNRCDSLQELTLPDSVAELGECAFSSCVNLRTVRLGSGLKSIGDGAFSGCNSLESLNIFPEGLAFVGNNAFYGCPARFYCGSVNEPARALNRAGYYFQLADYPNVKLMYRGNELIAYAYDSTIESAELPEGVTIGSGAFCGCKYLTGIVIPESVELIEESAICDCPRLSFLALPHSLTGIRENNFQNCPALVLQVYEDSAAELWALENAIPYQYAVETGVKVSTAADSTANYDGLSLVLSGDGIHAVQKMDNRASWRFYNLAEGETYSLEIRNSYGQLISETTQVTTGSGLTKLDLPALKKNTGIHLAVRGDDMKDVSASAEIVWLDQVGAEFASGPNLTNIPLGTKLTAKVKLLGEPALIYAQPEPYSFTVNENSGAVGLYLTRAEGDSSLGLLLSGVYTAANGQQSAFNAWDTLRYDIENITGGETDLAAYVSGNTLALGSQAMAGDELRLTVSAPDGDFLPVTTSFTMNANMTLELDLLQRGVLTAAYEADGGADMLVYDADGRLAWHGVGEDGGVSTTGLPDGTYSVVLMRRGLCAPAPLSLSSLAMTGLVADVDYLTRVMTCTQGSETVESFGALPAPQHSGGYFDALTFSASQTSPTAGRYFSLKAAAAWKNAVAEAVTDAVWTIELPDTVSYAADTLTLSGEQPANAQFDGNRILVPMDELSDVLRVCLIPLCGGEMEITGSLSFTLEGERVSLPMEPVRIQASSLKINAPEKANVTTIQVWGELVGRGDIAIYDNGVLAGQTTADGSGAWSAAVELVNPYTYTHHTLQAVYAGPYGEIASETASVLYQYVEHPITVKSVTMSNDNFGSIVLPMVNSHLGENIATTAQPISSYIYNPSYKTFRFDVHFEGEELAKLTSVNVVLGLSDGSTISLPAVKQSDTLWTCSREFTTNALPKTVTVSFNTNQDLILTCAEDTEPETEDAYSADPLELISVVPVEEPDFNRDLLDQETLDSIEEALRLAKEMTLAYELLNQQIDSYNKALQTRDAAEQQVISQITALNHDMFDESTGRVTLPNYSDYSVGISQRSVTPQELTSHGYRTISVASGSPARVSSPTSGTNNTRTPSTAIIITPPDTTQSEPTVVTIPSITQTPSSGERIVAAITNFSEQTGSISLSLDILGAVQSGLQERSMHLREQGLQKQANHLSEYQNELRKNDSLHERKIQELEAKRRTGDFTLRDEKALEELKNVRDWNNDLLSKAGRDYNRITDNINNLEAPNNGFLGRNASRFLAGASLVFDVSDMVKYANYLHKLFEWREAHPDDPEIDDLIASIISYMVAKAGMIGLDLSEFIPGWGSIAWGAELFIGAVDFFLDEDLENRFHRIEERYSSASDSLNSQFYRAQSDTRINPFIDPSGFVYEAVLSNTLSDAQASVWQKQTLYDQYDEPYEEITLWKAEDYGQTNPQRTEADGVFAWDVPDGLWQVRVSKNGYEDAASEWLTVPPIQKDIHIGMVSLAAPQINAVSLGSDAVTLRFDKYMDVSTLQDSISLTVNGTPTGALAFPDAEADPKDGEKLYARTVTIALADALTVDTALSLSVTTDAVSYAGVPLETAYRYEQTIEDVASLEVKAPELTKNQEGYITLIALPASAAAGRTVTVTGDLEALGVETNAEIVLNAYGRASIPVKAQSAGSFLLRFALSGSELTAEAAFNVGVRSLALVKDSILLAAGIDVADSAVLSLRGTEITAADLYWTSDHPEVVQVQNGVLTAVGGGTATVTGTLLDKSVACTVHVLANLNGLRLPAALTEIEDEAFRNNDSIQLVLLPGSTREIGDYAFADDDSLLLLYVPSSVSVFGDNILDGSDAVTVFVDPESDAETWCRAQELNYQYAA